MTPRRARRTATDPTVAVAYIRVSTDEQTLGPKAQRDSIERWAATNSVTVVAWHEDLGVSGATSIEARPALLAAVDALGAHGAGLMVVAKRDRLARDVVIAAMLERLVERGGAQIVSADGTGNGSGPEAQMMRGIVAVFAEYERAIIRARTKSALAAKRARGERVSRHAPIGWGFDEEGRKLVRIEGEQVIVQRVCEMHAGGSSLNGISRQLNSEGVPCRGTHWFPMTILRIVRASNIAA